MTYMVVRKGQLVEHNDSNAAQTEAVRLATRHGDQFYVVKVMGCTQEQRTITYSDTCERMPPYIYGNCALLLCDLLDCSESRVGAPWSKEEDRLLRMMWQSDGYTVHALAEIFCRNPKGIHCRLRKLGFYNVIY